MANTWGISWGTSWGVSWGAGSTPPTPPVDTATPGWVKLYQQSADARRARDHRKREEEAEKTPLEIIKIGTAEPQKTTTALHPVNQPLPKPTLRTMELYKLAESQFSAARIRGKKLRQLQQADDEWLMLN